MSKSSIFHSSKCIVKAKIHFFTIFILFYSFYCKNSYIETQYIVIRNPKRNSLEGTSHTLFTAVTNPRVFIILFFILFRPPHEISPFLDYCVLKLSPDMVVRTLLWPLSYQRHGMSAVFRKTRFILQEILYVIRISRVYLRPQTGPQITVCFYDICI